jgi:adenosylcobinamide-GDP ribazoletransferase
LAPILGRTVIVLLLLATPYVRPAGLGAPYAEYLPRLSGGVLALVVAVSFVILLGWSGGAVLAVLGIGFLGFRCWLLIRLGGATGDTLGAACELPEVGVLLGMVLVAVA